MKKLFYLSLCFTPFVLIAMERVKEIDPALRGAIMSLVAQASTARQLGPEKYDALRTFLQNKRFSSSTGQVIDAIADAEFNTLVDRDAKFNKRNLTEDEKTRIRHAINPWYIAVELGTPPALDWIKTHPAKTSDDIDKLRDARNQAVDLNKPNFSNALLSLETNAREKFSAKVGD